MADDEESAGAAAEVLSDECLSDEEEGGRGAGSRPGRAEARWYFGIELAGGTGGRPVAAATLRKASTTTGVGRGGRTSVGRPMLVRLGVHNIRRVQVPPGQTLSGP